MLQNKYCSQSLRSRLPRFVDLNLAKTDVAAWLHIISSVQLLQRKDNNKFQFLHHRIIFITEKRCPDMKIWRSKRNMC